MPYAPRRPCAHQGCPKIATTRYHCEKHALEAEQTKRNNRQQRDALRGQGKHAKLYGAPWRKARRAFLKVNPQCCKCGVPATTIDHIVPHNGDLNLFWDRNNWQPLCQPCHSRKTAKYDGGFGHAARG